MTTGLLTDMRFIKHDTGPGHPECGERVAKSIDYLKEQNWFNELSLIESEFADNEQIIAVHDKAYLKRAEDICNSGSSYLDSMDVSICRESFQIAKLAVGSAIALTDNVIAGKIDNGFALLRPPGHHAENSMALGFCIFNNIAIVARYLQQQYQLDKIAIVDWDVHHGNGTQHLFEEDPSVLYISTHQFPYYPGTGNYNEVGMGKGTGATLNCPMGAGAADSDYQAVFQKQVLPKLEEFKPECILISAGFDAHYADPLAQIQLTDECYGWMTEKLMAVAEKHCNGRIISLLEGGYDLEALPRCIALHINTLKQKK
ncbi:MAG: histone deacetylase [Pseudomonadota bacterium]